MENQSYNQKNLEGASIQYQPAPGNAGGMGEQWMVIDPSIQIPTGCPRGLEYLMQLDQIIVKQKVELFEVFTGCEMKNKYQLLNSLGQKVYFAQEDTDCCNRQCCGPLRPFEMPIVDNNEQEVIHLSRPLNCQGCLFPCCLQELTISSGGSVLGHVVEKWSMWEQKFDILGPDRDVVLRIEGPCWTCRCCADVEFKVLALDGEQQVGRISKQWTGFGKEFFTDADTFALTFPLDMDVKMKAVMIGACFLIDFMFFEQQNNN